MRFRKLIELQISIHLSGKTQHSFGFLIRFPWFLSEPDSDHKKGILPKCHFQPHIPVLYHHLNYFESFRFVYLLISLALNFFSFNIPKLFRNNG